MGNYRKLIEKVLGGASDANIPFADLMDKYEIIIYWSDEDGVYVADVPELPGCMAHGNSYELALSHARAAIRLWVDTSKEFGDPIPAPKGRRLVYA